MNVCSRRWSHAGAWAWRRYWLLGPLRLPGARGTILLNRLLFGRGTILFKQLLGRVVLCSLLQALDGRVALLVQFLEVDFGVANAVVEVAHKRIAQAVDTGASQTTNARR